MSKNNKKAADKISPNEQRLIEGMAMVKRHRLFGSLLIDREIAEKNRLSKGTAAIVFESGDILLNKYENHTAQEWAYIIAHCMLHLCFGHFSSENMPGYFEYEKNGDRKWVEKCDRALWNMACDIFISKFLADIKFGVPICSIEDTTLLGSDERKIYDILVSRQIKAERNIYGTAAGQDMNWNGQGYHWFTQAYGSYAAQFAYAVSDSVREVIDEAGGVSGKKAKSVQQLAAEWFINHYPLLGGLASGFKLYETGFGSYSALKAEVSIAAIDVSKREIYVNSAAGLSLEEWKFVLAHEYLHAGLQHHERRNGRQPYLWNIACDFVINGWLNEMQIGLMPKNGLLYDEKLKGCSAEEIYDILIKDLRKNSKLETFRGYGKGDILDEGYGKGDILDEGYAQSKLKPTSLDDFCKNALRNGLEYHQREGRGFIPAGLIEEIKALSMPPVPWDVELAKWFDTYFSPLEKRRTYARPSRRQSCSPDIPRPSYTSSEIPENSRTYGVIIDTSGSMSAKLLGMALGAVASYSAARDVPYVRVVFCDANAYDIGYVPTEDIAGRVEVKGRGGTALQPAVDLLEHAEDFPKKGPILIITDGCIEEDLVIHCEHAFLIPKGRRLPFNPKGKVFYFHE